jgi:hypothetical protein
MASALVKLLQKHLETLNQNADNEVVLVEQFLAVARLVPQYWAEAVKVKQTKEIKDSQKKFHWGWIELPDFPLRKFIPPASKALHSFPKNRCLVMILGDLFEDICKQVMMNKQEALKQGIVTGFLNALLNILVVAPPSFESLRDNEATLINCCLLATEKCSITPSNGFYDKALKVKNEFFLLGRVAWTDTESLSTLLERLPWPEDAPPRHGVNKALQLLVFLLHYLPANSIGTQSCLQLLKNMSEGFEAMLPVQDNPEFLT